jgi:hypothetical protein
MIEIPTYWTGRVKNGTWFRNGKPTKLALRVYYLTQKELEKERKRGGYIAKKKNAYTNVVNQLVLSGNGPKVLGLDGSTIQIMCHQIDNFFSLRRKLRKK